MKAKVVNEKGVPSEEAIGECGIEGPFDAVDVGDVKWHVDDGNLEDVLIGSGAEGSVDKSGIVVSVKRQFKEDGDLFGIDDDSDEMNVRDFCVEPARTGIRLNTTVNMGNFWSVSVQVNVDVPCYFEELDSAFNFAAKFAAERLESETEKAKARVEELRKKRNPKKGSREDLF